MRVTWEALTIDVRDPSASARWWTETLGWDVASEEPDGVEVRPPDGNGASLFFVLSTEAKVGKNRLHLDLYADDQAEAVRRLVDRGAKEVDLGHSRHAGWVVLTDPDGNEFCLLEPRNG